MEANRNQKLNQWINNTYVLMMSLMQCSDNVVTYVDLKYRSIGIRDKEQ